MAKTAHTPSWLKLFRPQVDFFSLLRCQSESTLSGARAFHSWCKSDARGRCEEIHALEHKADDQKMEIEKKLSETVVTPFDREDIYDISARLDLIINGLKKVAKDVEYHQQCRIDQFITDMAERLVEGTELIVKAVDFLQKDLAEAEKHADQARKTESKLAALHRQAMKNIYAHPASNDSLFKKEVYDSLTLVASRIEGLGEKLLHLSIKLS